MCKSFNTFLVSFCLLHMHFIDMIETFYQGNEISKVVISKGKICYEFWIPTRS